MRKILFRVDASVEIGGGHLVRCLALARRLQLQGCKASFLSRNLPEGFRRQAADIELIDLPAAVQSRAAGGLPWEEDARQTRDVIEKQGPFDWLVVDHYGIDQRWEARVRGPGGRLLVVDDLATSRHRCDLLLNQNLVAGGAARYRDLVPEECQLLVGPEFALLRKEFAPARTPFQRSRDPVVQALVSLGSTDPEGGTMRALLAIERVRPPGLAVAVVVGAANPHRAGIERYCAAREHLRLIVQADAEAMARLMLKADIAIGAGGSSLWERCCLGLPSLVLGIASNQFEVGRAAAKAGLCIYAGDMDSTSDDELDAKLGLLLDDADLRRSMAKAGQALVDGRGCARVATRMIAALTQLRLATMADAEIAYVWRNSPETRRYSADARPRDLASHLDWFRRAIADESRVLLMGEDATGTFGVLRYDLAGAVATVSIYLDPRRRGQGYGGALLVAGERWLRERNPGLALLRASVKPENLPSRRLFAADGFGENGEMLEKPIADLADPAESGSGLMRA